MPNLSIASQIAFSLAIMEAQALNSKYIDTEHLFLGLCKIEDFLFFDKVPLQDIGEKDWEEAREEIKDFKDYLESKRLDPKKARRRLRKILHELQSERGEFSGHRTPRCREVFAIAESLCRNRGETSITLMHLFTAVLTQKSPSLDLLFSELCVDRDELMKSLAEAAREEGQPVKTQVMTTQKQIENEIASSQPKKTKTPFLDKFGRDITKLAREGKLDPVIGRKEEIRKVAQILSQKKKNNPILVGDAGTGKTCIVEGLAQKIVEPDAPPIIRNLRIIELSMSSLVAGTRYRGEFEERLENLIKEAASDTNIVLFIDEIHTMVGAGKGEGAMDASNILKPALARGAIKCIGATTTAEYRRYIEKDPALERRFQIVWVDEPTKEEAILILKGLKPKFEEYHGLKIPDEVIEKAVEFSMRYLTDFRLPDKAIDIIDQACAKKVLQTLSPIRSKEDQMHMEITIEDVAKVVSERCRIPVGNLTVEESERLLKMEEHLRQRVIGQNHAIKEIAETIRSAKAGLKDPKKPLGTFLFMGSTGTGKTELAKALAEFLFYDENRLIVFDMSEYQEKHAVSKLIGAPPGYVGYEEEGQLTGKVRTNPYSVILFDEVEKAHPEIFDILLQIFDEGRLTDAHGRRVNFSETVIILTSNIGSNLSLLKKPIGIDIEKNNYTGVKTIFLKEEKTEYVHNKWKDYEEQIYKAMTEAFRPEFLNRIQKKIIFYPLSRKAIQLIIDKIAKELNQRLSEKGIQVVLSDSAKEFLIEKGYNEIYGAREMQRTFDHYISEPLSQMIIRGDVKAGQKIQVSASAEQIYFDILK